MAAPRETTVHFRGAAGALEGLLVEPIEGKADTVAVVCHPHPLHHGTMNNKVVHTLAKTFAARGMAVLRFNFRGVGESEGGYDEGRGEAADAQAALDWMQARHPGAAAWMAGFSFGSFVALQVAQATPLAGLILVAPPVERFAFSDFQQPECPWLVVQGDADDVVALDEVLAWVDGLYPGPALTIMNDVGHFFHGHLTELRATIEEFMNDA